MSEKGIRRGRSYRNSELIARQENQAVESFRGKKNGRAGKLAALPF